MRTIRTWLTTIAVLLCSITVNAETVQIDGIWYNLISKAKQAEVINNPDGETKYIGEISIPPMVRYNDVQYNVTSIGENAFLGCSNLTSITLSEGVTSIGRSAFQACNSLASLILPESVTNIGESAFSDCRQLISAHLPKNAESIGAYAFSGCSRLTSMIIPEGITSIGYATFSDCSSLASIAFPESVDYIYNSAFTGCNNLSAVHINNIENWCNINFDDSPLRYGHNLYLNGELVTELTIPGSAYGINSYAFWGCTSLTSVFLAEGVKSIGGSAFQGCTNLTSITLPESLKSIGNQAFYGCSNLSGVIIPEGVTSIYERAFKECTNLTSIVLPKSIKYLYDEVFADCEELLDVYCYAEDVPSIYPYTFRNSYPEYVTLHIPENSLEAYKAADVWKEFGEIVAITNQPSSIDSGIYTSGDTEITWEYTSDGELKFEGVGCIPDIDNAPWKNYQSEIKKVTIGEGITSINYNAFYYCSNITSITIPESVTSIGSYAFDGCEKLNSVYISSIESWCNINYGGASSFPLCSSHNGKMYLNGTLLTHLIIPNTITTMYQYTFSGFSDLFSVVIPESVITVSPALFAYCSSLREVRILGQIRNIQPQAFMNCSNLESFICYSIVPPAFTEASVTLPSGSEAFFGVSLNECTLYVPEESINAYKTAYKWNEFGEIRPIPKKVEILDTQEAFTQEKDENCANITYTRTFKNTNWNALYVPFEIPLSTLADNYDIAYINDIHTWANEESGEIEKMTMEVIKITDADAVLNANHPYLIRPKSEEAKLMNIVVTDATLYAAEEMTLDCSSMYTKFEVTGSYRRRTVEDLKGSLVLGGGTWITMTEGTMNPFRLFLTITNREGSPVKINPEAAKSISIRTRGEDDGTTDIEYTEEAKTIELIYDLHGRRVSAPQKGGLYIVNGKKIIY